MLPTAALPTPTGPLRAGRGGAQGQADSPPHHPHPPHSPRRPPPRRTRQRFGDRLVTLWRILCCWPRYYSLPVLPLSRLPSPLSPIFLTLSLSSSPTIWVPSWRILRCWSRHYSLSFSRSLYLPVLLSPLPSPSPLLSSPRSLSPFRTPQLFECRMLSPCSRFSAAGLSPSLSSPSPSPSPLPFLINITSRFHHAISSAPEA